MPDDVLALLSRFHVGLGNEYIWDKKEASIAVGSTSQTVSVYSGNTVTVYYADSVKVSNGVITLDSPSSFSITNGNSVSVDLTNKYFYTSASSNVYKAISVNSTSLSSYVLNCYAVTIEEQTVGYVNSADANAYPPSMDDGYTYTALGQLGNKVQIATGSYNGTGNYGESNPNSLAFGFEPKLVFMFKDGFPVYGSVNTTTSYPVYGTTIGMTTAYSVSLFNIQSKDYYLYAKKSRDGKKLSWYHEASANAQMNVSGVKYQYIAIG